MNDPGVSGGRQMIQLVKASQTIPELNCQPCDSMGSGHWENLVGGTANVDNITGKSLYCIENGKEPGVQFDRSCSDRSVDFLHEQSAIWRRFFMKSIQLTASI
jgi:hypothetical protein